MRHAIPGMTGVDTRRLTRHLRDRVRCPAPSAPRPEAVIAEAAAAARPTDGIDLVSGVSATTTAVTRGSGPYRVVAYDFGIKEAMVRQLADLGHRHGGAGGTPRPTRCSALEPDGVFLSNGPGDPAALPGSIEQIRRRALRRIGRRSSASASATSSWPPRSAARTYKLPFGHHGGNHPVQRLATGQVEIT